MGNLLEVALDAGAFVASTASVVLLLLARRGPREEPVVEDETVPEWGTQERKRWHAQQRDFHAAKVVEAGAAARLKESE